jgi:hypothetical protein
MALEIVVQVGSIQQALVPLTTLCVDRRSFEDSALP